MTRKHLIALGGGILALAIAVGLPARPAAAQGQQEQKPAYTLAEYNAYQAANAETNPENRIKLLDDFMMKYPMSTLLPYVYQDYITTYNAQKDYAKVIEYADKLVAMGDKVPADARLRALVQRSTAFEQSYDPKKPDIQDELMKEKAASQQGLMLLGELPKPAKATDEQFADSKKPAEMFFDNALGFASLQLKDYAGAASAYKAVIALDPKQAIAYYRVGVAYLEETPPMSMDGFWNLAKAIDMNVTGEAQVRMYLRGQIQRYELTGCDSLLDQQVAQLLTLAQTAQERPVSFMIPASADLDKIRQGSTILTVLSDLSAGGDKATNTWLAVCGSEFQDVPGKVIDKTVDPSNGTITYQLYTGASQQDMDAATMANSVIVVSPMAGANLSVKIPTTSAGTTAAPADSSAAPAGQAPPAAPGTTPAAATSAAVGNITVPGETGVDKFEKGDYFRYTGTLVTYGPQPVTVYWDKAAINPEDIPNEKTEPGKRHRAPAPKTGQ